MRIHDYDRDAVLHGMHVWSGSTIDHFILRETRTIYFLHQMLTNGMNE